jgi:hypothetical protein
MRIRRRRAFSANSVATILLIVLAGRLMLRACPQPPASP